VSEEELDDLRLTLATLRDADRPRALTHCGSREARLAQCRDDALARARRAGRIVGGASALEHEHRARG
jgi:hypothetical protein